MITLAIDPSINYPGYAVFDGKKLVHYGMHTTYSGRIKPSDRERLGNLYGLVEELSNLHGVSTVVLEDYQFRDSDTNERNKEGIKKMIWAIGVCVVAVPNFAEVVMVKPLQWKGKKSKTQTIAEVRIVYGIKGDLNNNAADAIMIGHHHINSLRGKDGRKMVV